MLKKINWRYALGEILIVIFGITIAFSLNSWGENRKSGKAKLRYLQNLKKDLKADILSLDSNIVQLQQRMTDINTIRKFSHTPSTRMDTVLSKFYNLAFPIEFRPRNITYQTLINSGDFKLIDDFDLKALIQEHYLEYDHILEVYERQNILADKYLSNYFINDLNFRDIYENKNYDFMKTNFFSNIINAQYGTFDIKIKASKVGILSCQKLINAVEEKI